LTLNPSYLFATREEQAGAGKGTRSKPVKAIRIFQGVGKPDVKLLAIMGLSVLIDSESFLSFRHKRRASWRRKGNGIETS